MKFLYPLFLLLIVSGISFSQIIEKERKLRPNYSNDTLKKPIIAGPVIPLTEINGEKKYRIGDKGFGGIIFWVDDNGMHGLVAASSDQNGRIQWKENTLILSCNGVRNDGIYTGRINTDEIISKEGDGNYAAMICARYLGGGYADWYLPSKYELNLMYINIGQGASAPYSNFGGFAEGSTSIYWSSTEYGSKMAWNQSFNDGSQAGYFKDSPYRVRAIRAF